MQHPTASRFSLQFFSILFALVVSVELLSEWTGNIYVHRISKPLIMLSLLMYAILQTRTYKKSYPNRVFLLLGMVCGLTGDVVLMFKNDISWAVQSGLGAFLVGHLFYITAFCKGSKAAWSLNSWWIAGFVMYGTLLLLGLLPFVGKMLVPLMVYAVVLLTMALFAKEREHRVTMGSYRLVWFGALSFVASDSVLSYYLFIQASAFGGVILMALYAAAQYGICMGMLEEMNSDNVEIIAGKL